VLMRLVRRIDHWLHRRRRDAELAEEMAFHRAELARRTPAAAAFGNATLAREDARSVWIAPWIESVVQDLRIGVRMLRRSPGTTAVAIATMALGIGANTAVYTLVDAALFRPLQVTAPDRLVFFAEKAKEGMSGQSVTFDEFEYLRDHTQTLAGLAAFDDSRVSGTIDGKPEMMLGDFVTANYFDLLGVLPERGRTFVPRDDAPGAPPVAVLGYGYWQRRFGADATVVGRAIVLGGLPCTIVGVAPRTYHGRYPAGSAADVTLPMSVHAELALSDHTTFELVGRLRDAQTAPSAGAELDGLLQQVRGGRPLLSDDVAAHLSAIAGALGERAGVLGPQDARQVVTVAALVGVLLLIVCVNVATLLFARAAARRKEIAVRLSIGAGPLRLFRQFLTESVLLAVLGGIASLLIAQWSASLLQHILPLPDLTINPATDRHALLFTGGLSVFAGLLLGCAPAAAARRLDVSPVLKAAGAGWTQTAERRLSGKTLVIAQVSISVALLAATGLLVQSLRNLQHVEMGLNADRVLESGIYPVLLRFDRPREVALYEKLMTTLESVPGVESASLDRYWLGHAGVQYVSPRLFATLGVPILEGRDLSGADITAHARVAVINEAARRRLFPDGHAIGREVPASATNGHGTFTVVGVAHDIATSRRQRPAAPGLFVPYTLARPDELGQVSLLVRTRGPAASMAGNVRAIVRSVEPNLALLGLQTLSAELDRGLEPERTTAALAGVCGVLALALAAVGLYGTLSHAISRRTREIGVRLSLGATRSGVVRMVLRESAGVIAAGAALGIPLTLTAARGLSALLFGVGAADPFALGVAVALLFGVAMGAAYLPARRAARVDPLVALRQE